MFLLAISNPLSWGEWGAGLAQTMGHEVFHRFVCMHTIFFQLAPGSVVSSHQGWEPCAVSLAPGVTFVVLVPPDHHLAWKGLPISLGPFGLQGLTIELLRLKSRWWLWNVPRQRGITEVFGDSVEEKELSLNFA